MSETSDVGGSGFLDDEAEEGFLSSELEEMAWEASGESDGCEGGDWCEGSGGFIVDEAEEEEAYQARRRRRRAVVHSSSEDSDEEEREERKRRGPKRRAYIADSSEDNEGGGVGSVVDGGASKESERLDKECVTEEGNVSSRSGDEVSESGSVILEPEVEQDESGSLESEQDLESSSSSSEQEELGEELESDNEGGNSESDSGSDERMEQDEDTPLPGHLKWKEGLTERAQEAYKKRLLTTTNLHKLIYSTTPTLDSETDNESDSDKPPEVGGMFRVAEKQQISLYHKKDTSLVVASLECDWSVPENAGRIKSLFVTGHWGAEDAEAMLAEDDALYGDFEDLETGHTHIGNKKEEMKEIGVTEEEAEKKRTEKKKKQKAAFDSVYDDGEGEGGSYLDDLKREVSEQERRNREEFGAMDDATRQLYEGVRAGSYVRMELKGESGHTVQ